MKKKDGRERSAPANKVYCFALWEPDEDDGRKETRIFRTNEILLGSKQFTLIQF